MRSVSLKKTNWKWHQAADRFLPVLIPVLRSRLRAIPSVRRKSTIVSGKQVEGKGLVYVVYCSGCDPHWIYEEVSEYEELNYTYLERDLNREDVFHIIPRPF